MNVIYRSPPFCAFRLSSSLCIQWKLKRHVLLLLLILTPVHLKRPSNATGKWYRSPRQLILTMKHWWFYISISSLTVFQWKMHNWSSPGAGPYVCIELRACAEEVAYGHLKSRACAEEVAYTGICNGCIHAQEKHIRAFEWNDRLLAKITAPPIENLHVYLSVLIYILVRKFVSCNNLFFLFNKRTIAHENFVILSYLIQMVKVWPHCVWPTYTVNAHILYWL